LATETTYRKEVKSANSNQRKYKAQFLSYATKYNAAPGRAPKRAISNY